ncbi:hypothetical protein BDB00DRAFT_783668 [Zychaea mexicana]|uniref:uncharacterized protein n=1 Tax=Zychaea mexicana TaxID=64656 RepID=UPI0022FDB4E1|nr:uncharacterized protein BDB00DRAFT_783668 [Zychaea mexicana]KAI9499079.1 hypothetical protein BDB00DRAFT_783668 [Zychaea mexicana]
MANSSSDEEPTGRNQTSAPRIKLKLRINPSGNGDAGVATASGSTGTAPANPESIDDRKRKKHKKKKSHKKRKRQRNQDSDVDDEVSEHHYTAPPQHQQKKQKHHTHRHRRESEQVDIDGEEDYDNRLNDEYNHFQQHDDDNEQGSSSSHVHVGGKRPFALIHTEDDEEEEDNSNTNENMDNNAGNGAEGLNDDQHNYPQVKEKKQKHSKSSRQEESSSSFDDYTYSNDNISNNSKNTIHDRTVHPTETAAHAHRPHPPTQTAFASTAATTASTTTTKARQRTASVSTTATNLEHKPKKRGRPAKVKVPPKPEPRPAPEQPKRDLKTIGAKLLDTLEKRDSYGFFLKPVDTSIVTDYLTVIKHPMDFSTMRKKLKADEYSDIEDFRQDFLLIVTNAKTYNAPDTIYYRNADRLEHMGLKAIDRAAKSVVYDSSQPTEEMRGMTPHSDTDQHSMFGSVRQWGSMASRRTSSISTAAGVKRESNVKMEEEVDILGLDNGSSIYPGRKPSRQQSVDTAMRDDAGSSRAGTPVRTIGFASGGGSTKKKKKKATEAGIAYASDGSLAGVGGVNDLQSLIPPEKRFSEVPGITMVNTHALPSAFYTSRASYDEWASNRHPIHPAHFADYGAYTALGNEPPGAFYTAQDACYIYPLYGDDRGEAYMRSLWEFAGGMDDEEEDDDDELTKMVYEKSKYLTRGAWDVLQETLKKDVQDVKDVKAEFGTLEASGFKKAYENATISFL